MRETAQGILRQIREGQRLSAAFAALEAAPPHVLGVLRASERSSTLATGLDEIASMLEAEERLAGRVVSALAYPALVATVGTISMLIIGAVVIPKFAQVLAELGETVPTAARVLLTLSDILVRYGPVLLFVGALVVVLGFYAQRSPLWRRRLHRYLIRLPFAGPIRHTVVGARVGKAMAAMLSAGFSVPPALEAAADACGDEEVGARLRQAGHRVLEGSAVCVALAGEAALPPAMLQLLQIGEGTGTLAEMTARAATFAERTAERQLQMITTLIEPVLVVGFGLAVAFVAAALLQAVYAIRPAGL